MSSTSMKTPAINSSAKLRREFDLPEEDVQFLHRLGLPWEMLRERNAQWLVIKGFPLPEGYTTSHASVALRIPPGYPTAPLDMAYFHPVLERADGRSIPQSGVRQQLDGRSWQRWSRHRTPHNQWQPGVDNVQSHLALVEHWLEREPKR